MNCGATSSDNCEFVSLGLFLDRSEKVGNVEVRQCIYCGHGITYPPIPDVAFLYGDRESQDYQPDAKNGIARAIKEIAFRRQAYTLIKQIGHPGKNVLDFGCGSGQFTRVLGECLQNSRVTGSDFYDAPPPELAGCPYVHSAALEQQDETYDLVMAMHVLEHDDDMPGLLARITAPAKHGGTVVIEVPNIECFWSKVLGRFWDAWYVPYHRNHFSQRSLRRLLEANGLDIVSIHGLTLPAMGRTVANMLGRRNNLLWLLVGIALHPIQFVGEKISGKPTALRVIAKKR